ncbi:MAG: hypothetical protein HYX68_10145 [Planctomycetes bacterium]|nr:hypothetical protein [Planctomycetota bacterium]
MTVTTCEPTLASGTLENLRQAGNPFRNFFARNPDDEICARYHVPELFALEREQLLGVVNLFRAQPTLHSELIPILGNKGAGKTHLLHSIKHGQQGAGQLLITPGTFQKDTDFLEYLLFQFIDTLLGGGKQMGHRPLESLSEEVGRRTLLRAMEAMSSDEQMAMFPAAGLGGWFRKLGLGGSQNQERLHWLTEQLARPVNPTPLKRLCAQVQLDAEKTCDLVWRFLDRTETHNTAGMMRRHIFHGLVRAALLGDESELANFVTYGFAEIDYQVKPGRQDLVIALFRVLMEMLQSLTIPVVIAFDQLEDLLLARRTDDGHRVAEAFFAGLVHAMHQLDGICFLVFAERGLWNRFVPSLDGYIQDRLNNPVHVPGHGTIKALRLEAPVPELVRRVVQARMAHVLENVIERGDSPVFPFTEEQVQQVARTEPTLRDMLQQFRQLFDHLVFGEAQKAAFDVETPAVTTTHVPSSEMPASVKSMVVVEIPVQPALPRASADAFDLQGMWTQALSEATARLAPDGSLTGATRELQAGLGSLLQICHEHGVKVGPWRLQHVVPEFTFSEHPTYGAMSIAHWVCKDGQPWKVGIGLFLGRGPGKPRDLETKLASLDMTPAVIDHLILLRPDDDVALTGKSKTIWQESERKGTHARLEPLHLDHFTILYAFPRWLATLSESLPPGHALPNLAEVIQENCEKLLEQVCMPVSS